MIHPQGVLNVLDWNYLWYYSSSQLVAPDTHTTGPKNHAAKHRLRTQKNITRNFSQARFTLPEDGSQRIRNMSEFLIVL